MSLQDLHVTLLLARPLLACHTSALATGDDARLAADLRSADSSFKQFDDLNTFGRNRSLPSWLVASCSVVSFAMLRCNALVLSLEARFLSGCAK